MFADGNFDKRERVSVGVTSFDGVTKASQRRHKGRVGDV